MGDRRVRAERASTPRASVPRRAGPTKTSLTPTPPILGVIFDFGGVLVDMRWDVSDELERAHGLPRHALLETLYRTPTWRRIERGQGDLLAWRAEAHRLLEARAGRPLPKLHDAWLAARHLIRANVVLARRLRPAHRTAILSNADLSTYVTKYTNVY